MSSIRKNINELSLLIHTAATDKHTLGIYEGSSHWNARCVSDTDTLHCVSVGGTIDLVKYIGVMKIGK